MAVVGGCVAVQAPVNAGLGRSTGSFAAATISFAVGTVLLAAIVVLASQSNQVKLTPVDGRDVNTLVDQLHQLVDDNTR